MQRIETTTYLEMTSRSEFRPVAMPALPLELKQVELHQPEFNRFFYTAIGGEFLWIDRLGWSYEQWLAYLQRPGQETWAAYLRGTPAGYFELLGEPGGDVELAFFGIMPQFIGQRIGGWLLSEAIRRAWDKSATRVWLHTSSFDHPHALRNYLARGFRIVRSESAAKTLPDETPGPWPAARKRLTAE